MLGRIGCVTSLENWRPENGMGVRIPQHPPDRTVSSVGLERWPPKPKVAGSSPAQCTRHTRLAQLAERLAYTQEVGGSRPPLRTRCGYRSVVGLRLAMAGTRVRAPLAAPVSGQRSGQNGPMMGLGALVVREGACIARPANDGSRAAESVRPVFAAVAQLVERVFGKDEAAGSSPASSSRLLMSLSW